MFLALVLCGNAYASDWGNYMRIDWRAVGNYFTGFFSAKSKDTPAPAPTQKDETLPDNIAENWGRITGKLTDTLTLRDKQETLPGWTWIPFREDKASNAQKINALLDEAVIILSDGKAGDARKEANTLREAILQKRAELDGLRNKRITAPEKTHIPFKMTKAKADERISELEDEIEECAETLEEVNERLAEALNEIGLDLDGSQVEILLNSVTGDDLMQNASVFSNVKAVVSQLEELAQNETNTLDITKRYTGMYLVLNDLLIHTQEELLKKIDEEYRPRLNGIITEAQALRKDALTKSNQNIYTMPQRRAFAQNAENNAVTIQVAKLYIELLNSQREITAGHIRALSLNRDLAENTYRTVRSSGELKGLIHTGLSVFDAIENLSMPELKVFESGTMRLEFEEINRRLKK